MTMCFGALNPEGTYLINAKSKEKVVHFSYCQAFIQSVLSILYKGHYNSLTVGFLDKKIEQNLELYKATFDIVLSDNASFKEAEEIIFKNNNL